jgi:hypothetical protein
MLVYMVWQTYLTEHKTKVIWRTFMILNCEIVAWPFRDYVNQAQYYDMMA